MSAIERDSRPRLLSPAEAADALGVSQGFVYARVRTGEIPVVRLGRGPRPRLRIDSRALAEVLVGSDSRREK